MVGRLGAHAMMPTFTLMEPSDIQEDFHLSSLSSMDELPKISVDDPAIISLKVELDMNNEELSGRVVKFLRRSLKAGIAPFYRQIVATPIAKEDRIWSV
jgi:DNA-directed RNA polymerase subunit H (RpoH/RPB5)|nr:RNA polymerase subunit RPB5 [uncultured Mediterranean phage uvMED]|tara:strand:+ start:32423 stop:32719 length:297 start_codon:yes stop_codon:yes gene_type:complete